METSRFQKHSSPRTPTKNHSRRNEAAHASTTKRENTHRSKSAPQTPTKNTYPKTNDYTSPQRKHLPAPQSPLPKHNGKKQSSRRHHVKEEGVSPYSSDSDSFEVSTPPRNSFLADDIYRKHKSGASPRNISRETTPDLILDEESSPRRNPNRESKKKGLYAGPTFSNAPTPDALPVPVFNGRSSSPKCPVHKSPSTHTYHEPGLTSRYHQPINVAPQPFVSENELRLRSQKLLSLLNGGGNGFSPAPQVYNNAAPCYYPEAHPVHAQGYPTFNLPYYQGFPPDSLGLPQTSIFVPA
ncbi:hypothetical protein K493DRAFT_311904 [Basidiobolus meristosporus CBS 931.73]|uniref:Uncharacterized protein n=1 Tax=Basidiobolus meristosporus CBS 931.73 TaxID=1314790 RepID=A0A1Y1YZ96_9FUNG|nr:hypothetical protein K493DRAFT_311904 [Basidiobolus meristosporus CBS 931.73]|eukprot:ORY03017.1 hypothetical protein K493DRAFT_311904 [Basidiobolus meristosporus CBS 931.73]